MSHLTEQDRRRIKNQLDAGKSPLFSILLLVLSQKLGFDAAVTHRNIPPDTSPQAFRIMRGVEGECCSTS